MIQSLEAAACQMQPRMTRLLRYWAWSNWTWSLKDMQVSEWVYQDEVCWGAILIDSQSLTSSCSGESKGVLMKGIYDSPNQLENGSRKPVYAVSMIKCCIMKGFKLDESLRNETALEVADQHYGLVGRLLWLVILCWSRIWGDGSVPSALVSNSKFKPKSQSKQKVQ